MSEEILKALTQLFAIITKQDGGVTDVERLYVIHFFQTELDQDSVEEYVKLYDQHSGYGKPSESAQGRLTSVSDSVKTLGICKKINQTLTKKQKVVVLAKLLEMVGSSKNFSMQRRDIINTIASVFSISQSEYHAITTFVLSENYPDFDLEDILRVDALPQSVGVHCKHFQGQISGAMIFLRLQSVDMYFTRYLGDESNTLNGFVMDRGRVYLFTHGSTIKTPSGEALYYSDIVSHFNDQLQTTSLSFNASLAEVKYPSGHFGLQDINISEGAGRLIGIMGASGSGKTTLLNVLAGLMKPERGTVKVNGIDLYTERDRVHGVIGYVSQDDILIEELTVFENLYFNARLCLAHLSDEKIRERVMEILHTLGLDQRKDLRVGSALDKVISGGQRKRLNIALELIRRPAILFLDEPTSGLSSRDSENVIDLLKELSQKGKLVFAVIHQPSSDIYKMFDKIVIMDTGGYVAYYGPPVEAITYFKRSTLQVDSHKGQCKSCGSVNPEQIFNIIEARVVDEYGQPTPRRKVSPQQWHDLYKERFTIMPVPEVKQQPPRTLQLPGRLKQTAIFATRDAIAKISNKQYLLVNLVEAPLLALLLAFVIKYNSAPDKSTYVFRYNDNFPAFILISIIVALFMGLSVSAEEIIRDRKILKRESFLHLSWNSYLCSKLSILFSLSAIQTFTFVLVGHLILEIEWRMLIPFWFVLFSLSCMANVMGLNISSAFRSAVTVYVLIPLLLIPQMVLSGLLFSFDRLNDVISTKGRVPIIADLMASRWAYEAMAVYHFTNNSYEAPYYQIDKVTSRAGFRSTYLSDALEKKRRFIEDNFSNTSDSVKAAIKSELETIQFHLADESYRGSTSYPNVSIVPATLGSNQHSMLEEELAGYKRFYRDIYNRSVKAREAMAADLEKKISGYDLTAYKSKYYNESLAGLVTKATEKDRILEHNGLLIQQVDGVFLDPSPRNRFDYRAHFFAPRKNLVGSMINTYWFNLIVIWIMTLALYVLLYVGALKAVIGSLVFRGFISLKRK